MKEAKELPILDPQQLLHLIRANQILHKETEDVLRKVLLRLEKLESRTQIIGEVALGGNVEL